MNDEVPNEALEIAKNLAIHLGRVEKRCHIFISAELPDHFNMAWGQIDVIEEWCKDNCIGLYYGAFTHYRFELEEDATAFKLRWA
jgi:hypothetical protein